jgi:hypothetical protein
VVFEAGITGEPVDEGRSPAYAAIGRLAQRLTDTASQ